MQRASPSVDRLRREGTDDEELDATDDKFSLARNRLFNRGANRSSDERNFSDASYWDDRYRKSNQGGRYDWYGVWDGPSKVTMKPHVEAFMPAASSPILNIGCGNSRFPEELYDDGYSNLVNIDISQVAVDRMVQESGSRRGMSFLQMDATSMSFEDGSFAAVFEKGTLDALYTNSADLAARTASEAFRVLRPGGLFVSVTFGHPSSRRELNATPSHWGSFHTVALEKETGRSLVLEKGYEADAIYIYIMVKPEASPTSA